MEKAKKFITDALVGLILALLAYLILYIINPELVKIKMGGISTTTPTATTPIATTPTGGKTCTGSGGTCSQVDSAIGSNAFGIDTKVLKTILAGGEGCAKRLSDDGFGSCGYSQALPKIRTACGISGTANETCAAVQNDVQLDVNCAAWLVSNQSGRCTKTDYIQAGCCYNGGPNNADCHKSVATNYKNKLTNYYEKYCK